MPEIPVNIDLSWYHVQLLKEIEEKHYDSHKIVKMIKMISERNIEVICKLFEYFKENGIDEEDDIKSFIEKYW